MPPAELAQDFYRHAFDTIAAAERITSIEELNAAFRVDLANLGLEIFLVCDIHGSPGHTEIKIAFGHGVEAWGEHYMRTRSYEADPITPELFYTAEPFNWVEHFRHRQLSPAAKRVLDDAKEFGAVEGLITPLHGLGSISSVTVAGRKPDMRDPMVRVGGHILSSYYASMGRRIMHGKEMASVTAPHLTDRQVECLKWVRAGKTSYEIGVILGISSRVVDEHVAAACERLHVRTRAQAVIEAAAHSLLSL